MDHYHSWHNGSTPHDTLKYTRNLFMQDNFHQNRNLHALINKTIGGLAVVAFWRSPHGPLGSGPPRAGYSQKRKRKEKGEKGKRRKKERKKEKEKKRKKVKRRKGRKLETDMGRLFRV